jgi:hypothetical protein
MGIFRLRDRVRNIPQDEIATGRYDVCPTEPAQQVIMRLNASATFMASVRFAEEPTKGG